MSFRYFVYAGEALKHWRPNSNKLLFASSSAEVFAPIFFCGDRGVGVRRGEGKGREGKGREGKGKGGSRMCW
jgi:hypothetical protein